MRDKLLKQYFQILGVETFKKGGKTLVKKSDIDKIALAKKISDFPAEEIAKINELFEKLKKFKLSKQIEKVKEVAQEIEDMLDIKVYSEKEAVTAAEVDEVAKKELELFIDNQRKLYQTILLPVYKNLTKKMKNDTYDEKQAPKAFKKYVEEGAKEYAKEFGSSINEWKTMFDKPTRDSLAEDYAREFETKYELKEYDFMD